MKLTNQIVAEAAEYVTEYLSKHLQKEFCYHDFFHTFSVVSAVGHLCTALSISKAETRILLVAAWFHDTGYTQQTDGHENISAQIAEQFLKNKSIDDEETETVKACIIATRYPQQVHNALEQIICDADLLYISEPFFMERSALLRKEWAATIHKTFTDKEWYELSLQFLRNHTFQTAFCRTQPESGKQKNAEKVTAQLEALNHKVHEADKQTTKQTVITRKERKEKLPALERGVETLFRLTSGNHMKLSGMADNKAHILLSINSIIISVTLSLLAKYLDEMPRLLLPTILLLCVCLVTIVFAILTTKPKVSKGIFTEEQIHNREANLLFFGNFHNMGWESYEWGIQEIMHDRTYLYRSMTKDIYFLGKVLATKYRYLNIGYKVFMFGLIASVLAFVISFI